MSKFSHFNAVISMRCIVGMVLLLWLGSVQAQWSMQESIEQAIAHDPWLQGSRFDEQALLASSRSSEYLPDPIVSLGMANVPVDGFSLEQEPMTQVKLGIAQQFPRGDSLALQSRVLRLEARQHPLHRADRVAQIRAEVGQLWLQVTEQQKLIEQIEQNRVLFEQLVDVVEAGYGSGKGNTRQQDIVQAQLELAKLDDKLTQHYALRDAYQAQLSQWLPMDSQSGIAQITAQETTDLPSHEPVPQPISGWMQTKKTGLLAQRLLRHPAVLAVEQAISAREASVSLARQAYEPKWGVQASYGHRQSSLQGDSRADLLSVGLTLEIPLFGASRVDHQVAASKAQREAVKTRKQLLLQKMLAQLQRTYSNYERTKERQQLYEQTILPQLDVQVDASLTAYTNDDGDFSQVMRARIERLNIELALLSLESERHRQRLQLDYYLTEFTTPARQGD